ncbi:MAG: hypothetical protein ACOYM8_11245 [Caulobacterales bacterium]|jgi:hypothetical protein
MRRSLLLATSAVAGALLVALAGCSSTSAVRNYDPVTCQIRNPKPGEPPFNIDCLAAAQASERASKESAARDAARSKKKN